MKHKLMTDISTIYSIRASILSKLERLAETCICDYLVEAKLCDDDLVEINVGIGKLMILILDDSVEYQFIPSNRLERLISKSIIDLKSPLEQEIEEGIEEKLVYTYKELF